MVRNILESKCFKENSFNNLNYKSLSPTKEFDVFKKYNAKIITEVQGVKLSSSNESGDMYHSLQRFVERYPTNPKMLDMVEIENKYDEILLYKAYISEVSKILIDKLNTTEMLSKYDEDYYDHFRRINDDIKNGISLRDENGERKEIIDKMKSYMIENTEINAVKRYPLMFRYIDMSNEIISTDKYDLIDLIYKDTCFGYSVLIQFCYDLSGKLKVLVFKTFYEKGKIPTSFKSRLEKLVFKGESNIESKIIKTYNDLITPFRKAKEKT